eukprot:m.129505 g.129505  ORF g.129505 m.129505 type:complete len:531 (+) comp37981_c0_seq7:154-1746(+)
MRCHYEVLGVGKDASDDDIKRSYRKMALKWHPDKNLDRAEEATRVFTEIQQAYDVLSDPQERAWYDNHREAILRGGNDYVDDSLNLMRYFSSSAYSGYGDDKNGYFAVFQKVFSTIVDEDTPFEGVPSSASEEEEIPDFGNSKSVYEETVHSFYAFWQSYCTRKTFVWLEKYDVRHAQNRWESRQMEKENKKLRDVARKERNELIRRLVSYVRKRDPRVKERQQVLKARQEEIAKRVEEEKLRKKRERQKELEGYKEQDWVAASRLDDELQAMENWLDKEFESGEEVDGGKEEESEGDECVSDDLYCVACDKIFKSANALVNHAQSKKHKESVAFLKAELLAEEGGEGFEFVEVSGDVAGAAALGKMSKKQRRKKRRDQQVEDQQENDDWLSLQQEALDESAGKEGEIENEDRTEFAGKQKHKQKKRKSKGTVDVNAKAVADSLAAFDMNDCGESALEEGLVSGRKFKDGKTDHTDGEANDQILECQICKQIFSSRNKLFQHIKATNHAVLVEKRVKGKSGKGSKQKKKR